MAPFPPPSKAGRTRGGGGDARTRRRKNDSTAFAGIGSLAARPETPPRAHPGIAVVGPEGGSMPTPQRALMTRGDGGGPDGFKDVVAIALPRRPQGARRRTARDHHLRRAARPGRCARRRDPARQRARQQRRAARRARRARHVADAGPPLGRHAAAGGREPGRVRRRRRAARRTPRYRTACGLDLAALLSTRWGVSARPTPASGSSSPALPRSRSRARGGPACAATARAGPRRGRRRRAGCG